MDDLAAGRPDPIEGGLKVIDREVGQRDPVPGPAPSLVHAERRPVAAGLPSVPLGFSPGIELQPEHAGPEGARPLGHCCIGETRVMEDSTLPLTDQITRASSANAAARRETGGTSVPPS